MFDFYSEYFDIITAFIIAVLLVIATKKCFMEKWSLPKTLLVILISPPLVVYTALELTLALTGKIFDVLSDPIGNLLIPQNTFFFIIIALKVLIEFLFCSGFTLLYTLIVKPKNLSVGAFVYLMYYYLTDLYWAMMMTYDFEYNKWFVVLAPITIIVNGVILYIAVIVPLSAMTGKKLNIRRSVFVAIPSAVMLFTVAINGIAMYVLGVGEVGESALLFVVSLLFMSFILILSYAVIVKNVKYTADIEKARDEVKTLSVEVMEALAHTIDAKDKYTNGHSVRVAKYSRLIAEKMGLPEETCENIYYMGLLHDIGKIGVPNEIINKTTRLTDSEYDIIKTHPILGYEILSEIKSRPDLAIGARWHHERYDGRGYPDRKEGADIPIESRIIAVADSYDAMTSNRSYRQYLPQDKVRSEIETNIGTQFDPEAAKYMLMVIDDDKDYVLHE